MRVWVDLTNSPHVPIFAPLIRRMQARGWDVAVTARRFAQTIELLELHGIEHTVVGHHGGGSRLGKARAAGGRVAAMLQFGRRGRFDAAIAHGSTDLPMACLALRVPNTTMFDYEFARLQHSLNCRLANRVLMPDAIPAARVREYGARPPKLVTLSGAEGGVLPRGLRARPGRARGARARRRRRSASCCGRRPTSRSTTGSRTRCSTSCSAAWARATTCVRWCCRGRPSRRRGSAAWRCRRCWCPTARSTAQSLLAGADLVVSAGGTMNREAVVLGTPVYTTFAGRLGGVDERLIERGGCGRCTPWTSWCWSASRASPPSAGAATPTG